MSELRLESILISDLAGWLLTGLLPVRANQIVKLHHHHIEERIERVEVEGTIGLKKTQSTKEALPATKPAKN